ncbi:hypothetical protein SpCBS45565_g07395 [Spizellomyces sp. 'palustris']|nr:hypothetical protein SpCBS45565_g07395 [Spizellomyces sp. 'palustris']
MGKEETEDRGAMSKLEDYRLMCKLGEGTFSEVLKVKQKKSGKISAMKRFRKHFNSYDEIENLREIQALRRLNPHQHIIDLEDIIFDPKHGILSLNFELMECNLYELISQRKTSANITEGKAKLFMYQICKALEYIHGKGIFHRDIKPENILVKDNNIKIADFGSCRGIHSKQPYTEYIATRWYRSPECLLTEGIYSYKMDIWGAGCVLFEIVSRVPLFPGTNELDQLHRIHAVMGTPSKDLLKHMLGPKMNSLKYNFPQKEGTGIRPLIPHISQDCVDLINALLAYNPEERITSREALKHAYFRDLQPEMERSKSSRSAAALRSAKTITSLPQQGSLPSVPIKKKSINELDAAPVKEKPAPSYTYIKAPKPAVQAPSLPTLPQKAVAESAPVAAAEPVHHAPADTRHEPVKKAEAAGGGQPSQPHESKHEQKHEQQHERKHEPKHAATKPQDTTRPPLQPINHPVPEPQNETLHAVPQHITARHAPQAHPPSPPAATSTLPPILSVPPLHIRQPDTSDTHSTTSSLSTSSFYAKFKQQMDDKKAAESVLARARRIRAPSGRKRGGGPSAGRRQNVPGGDARATGQWGHSLVGKNMTTVHKLPSIAGASQQPQQHHHPSQPTTLPSLTVAKPDAEKMRAKHGIMGQKDTFVLPSLSSKPKHVGTTGPGAGGGGGGEDRVPMQLPSIKAQTKKYEPQR